MSMMYVSRGRKRPFSLLAPGKFGKPNKFPAPSLNFSGFAVNQVVSRLVGLAMLNATNSIVTYLT